MPAAARAAAGLLALWLGACATPEAPAPETPAAPPSAAAPPPAPAALLLPADWSDLPGWRQDRLSEALPALRQQCAAPRRPATEPPGAIPPALLGDAAWWQALCRDAARLPPGNQAAARRFVQARFRPMQLRPQETTAQGLLTGYFEPVYAGCTAPGPGCTSPVRGRPPGLLNVDAGRIDPRQGGTRIRGCIDRGALSPCPDRAAIEAGRLADAPVLAWMDQVEKFFLQIQGSGRVVLAEGGVLRLGYAAQNFSPYVPIGRVLLEQGQLSRPVSMQSIRAWLLANPGRVEATLNANPSYVFFRVLDLPEELGPIGSLGVPLTPGRSVAVDPAVVPLGLPVYLATPGPAQGVAPRLAFAQDTGGAIRGVARADLFTGTGPEAGEVAGRLAAPLSLWVLLPNLPHLVAESAVTLPPPTLPPPGSAR